MEEMISLDDLNLFMRIVQSGSLTKASELLSVPLSTLSRRLTQLESAVGGRLLNRSPRTISLTSLGQLYYERCRYPLEECVEVTRHLHDCYHKLSGNIKVTAPINLSNQWVGDCLFAFMKQYPDVKIDLMVSNRMVDLAALNIDIAIRVGKLRDSDWVAKELLSSRNILCASANYLSQAGQPVHPEELRSKKTINASVQSGWDLIKSATSESYYGDIEPYLIIDDVDLIIRAARQDMGICFVPSQFVENMIACGELVQVLPEWAGNVRPIYLVFRDRVSIPLRVRLLKEYIEKYIAKNAHL